MNYDKENWQMLIKQLNQGNFKEVSTINRAQLIDDALNLARTGKLNYSTALDVTSYLVRETEYLPWKAALTAMSYLNSMLIKFQGYDKFRVSYKFPYMTVIMFHIINNLLMFSFLSL